MQKPIIPAKDARASPGFAPVFLLPGHGLGPVHGLQKSGHLPPQAESTSALSSRADSRKTPVRKAES